VREEDISHERSAQNKTLLLQAYMYVDIFSIRYYDVDCNDCPVCSLFIKFDFSSCALCKTVLGEFGLWVIYNSFEFVADAVYMFDLI
jgi:hypothetical protein